MTRPIRTTIVYALVSGIGVIPLALLLKPYLYWPTALKVSLWVDVAVYGVLMVRWSRTRIYQILFPLAILLGTALWPGTFSGFFILALGVFAWMRSGICFTHTPIRSLMAEMMTVLGSPALLLLIGSSSHPAWALNVCLFFLIQSLYFFIVPLPPAMVEGQKPIDPFEQAVEEAKKVLDSSCAG